MPEDVPKTIFVSPLGTFVSNVLQQGDCNGLSSWQRLMTYVFRNRIGVEVWVYIDDILFGPASDFTIHDSGVDRKVELLYIFNPNPAI
jgi:hypothetical protein